MDYQISYACMSHIGRRRRMNQDNFLCGGIYAKPDQPGRGRAPIIGSVTSAQTSLFGVFDGMGGEANGEQAALLCAQTLHTCSSDEPFDALDFFRRANVAVCDMIAASGQISGSTAATVHLTGNRAYCCNVGDSRIYLQRGGALQRISRDHTKYQEQLDAGAAAAGAEDNLDKHVLTQYLGMLGARQRLMPYFAASVPLAVGDRLLLCTDGLVNTCRCRSWGSRSWRRRSPPGRATTSRSCSSRSRCSTPRPPSPCRSRRPRSCRRRGGSRCRPRGSPSRNPSAGGTRTRAGARSS